MITAEGLHDIGGEFVSRDADRLVADDACQRDDRDAGGAAADIDDHISHGFFHVDADAECGGHGLMDEIDFFGARLLGTVANGPFFNFGNT